MAAMDSLFPELSRITTTSLPDVAWEDDTTTTERMENFLNSALCVIHNLSKSIKHREKFRTAEMRKTLDIYKGSPSSLRRMYSLSAISYMADPHIDMSLLEDKYGAIVDLADYLDKSLIPGNSTGWSVQELVEGMANLAVHPFNKDQIIDNSLHLFYKILESNINKNLTCYVRHVLDRWGFSDVVVGSTTGLEQCQREKEIQIKSEQHHDYDTNKSTDNMQMLDNLQCVLSECDSFGTNEVMEIIGAVKRIVLDKTSNKQNVLKHFAMHEWPGLLVRIISDVWKPNKEVYTNEVLWSIITDTIDTMITYSDVDVECADILIEHGALAIMQEVADAYYHHFKQKIRALHDKVSEYRGENSGELKADNRQSKDPTKTNISTGQPGTDGYQSMGSTTQTNIPSVQEEADVHQSMGATQTNILIGQEGADGHQSMGTIQANVPSGQQGADGSQSMGPTQTNINNKSSSEISETREVILIVA
ncbi:uncharacterized protein LOC117121855 [Anneissia japonica]|uniref:uncharacterized protein LOC117121855 n=1 Tax=Anneissia japonica TaxID=1529436 RepID=UPI001425A342|nr:uncharacterized protein LOC117121855 [Anneissia japonica]